MGSAAAGRRPAGRLATYWRLAGYHRLEVARRLVVYRRLVGAAVRSQLAYPLSFAMQCFGQAFGQTLELLAVLVLFGHVDALGGFGVREVLVIYGIAGMSFGLADMLVGQLDALPEYIRTGRLDALLLRPLGALGQICASEITLRRLGRSGTALFVLVYALSEVDIQWTAGRVLLAVLAPLTGTVILCSVWVVACSVCFWLIEARDLANAVTYGSSMFTGYPLSIFSPWLRRLMGFAVPGAFVAYFPALALLGKPDPLCFPVWLQWASPLVAAASAVVAGAVWRFALRHYRGTGS